MSAAAQSSRRAVFLLPDQMYEDELISTENPLENGLISTNTTTKNNNNPLKSKIDLNQSDDMSDDSELFESDYAKEMHKLLKSLEIWEDVDLIEPNGTWIYDSVNEKCARFLIDNNIRPDFFCQYEKILSGASSKTIISKRNGRKRSTTRDTSRSRSTSKNRTQSKKSQLLSWQQNLYKGKKIFSFFFKNDILFRYSATFWVD